MSFQTLVRIRDDGDADAIFAVHVENAMLMDDFKNMESFNKNMEMMLLSVSNSKNTKQANNNGYYIIELENVDAVISQEYFSI